MILKERTESHELIGLRYLKTRMELSENKKFYLANLESGYEGELAFDKLAATLQEERYILNDMLLEANNSDFQIDSMIVSEGITNLIDVKNLKGDYIWKDGQLYTKKGNKCKNPVEQLNKADLLFHQFLRDNKLNFLVQSRLVFIHPEFTLYNAPEDHSIILPTQVNQFIDQLNSPSRLNDGHKKLAQILLSAIKDASRYSKLPEYSYEKVWKGMFCKTCLSKLAILDKRFLACRNCDFKEEKQAAIVRNAKEFMFLFPERKLTIKSLMEWCQLELGRRTYTRVLMKYFKARGGGKNIYYE
ncbi:NERD domain-containing protein [Neobacillus notoginsengisoli]|uniref:NERD domain-containing protein n=1 Tax=Neobacillus notoginsengisoli TaxID=1578198 RepID=A0A417YVY5_9BACI|nr:nuclease-related domain-containing protein [Neobacillus notoginsengisoli]RHW41448.1 NERD domain-containing protein [Neobacillus notoginsengisoli]